MRYVKNGEVFSVYELRRAHPNVSIPEGADCAALGYDFLTETPQPAAQPWCRVVEGAPLDNTQVWVQEPLPADEIIAQCASAVQSRLDEFAQTRGYDGILSACTYATSAVPKFAAEGQYCVTLRDASWAKCYEILDAVQAGSRLLPTLDQLLAELPAMAWPA